MRLSKQGRSKKGHVAPMSDDDDNGNDNGDQDQRQTNRQTNTSQPRRDSRGVSFTTSRGRIWLILVINLAIVTAFIFMSSSRFPSLSGEGVVSDALEQDHKHPGPVNKNADQVSTLAASDSAMTKAPKTQENSRPGGYTKLTSTDHPETPDEGLDLTDATESETGTPEVPSDETAPETPIEPIGDEEKAIISEPAVVLETQEALIPASDAPSVPTETQETHFAASDIDQGTNSAATDADILSVQASTESQQSPADDTEPPSQIEESGKSSDTFPPPPQQSVEAELRSTASATPQSVDSLLEVQPASNAFLGNLSMWLAADSGVQVENLATCLASSGNDVAACGVTSWTSQIVNSDRYDADATIFHVASPQQRTVWVPIAPDTHNQLPAVYFSCPMVTETVAIHESMTLVFVISPAQIEPGDSYTGQKFFGNSPYGQFALHGGKPSFFANNGLVESDHVLPVGRFSLLTYRLHAGYVEIKVNGGPWCGASPVEGDTAERHVRITMNEVVSLGNSKSACDTNAFQGRIAEVLVYDAVLDNSKVEVVEKYLYDKWWGDKPFPETAAATSEPDPATKAPHGEISDDLPTLNPELSDSEPASKVPRSVDANNSPTIDPVYPTIETASNSPESDSPAAEETVQTSTTTTAEATPTPKFDPSINIFEWKPAEDGGTSPKAQQWTRSVKEKVDFIRNFQLGGNVLRALIRQHRDELMALREELFG